MHVKGGLVNIEQNLAAAEQGGNKEIEISFCNLLLSLNIHLTQLVIETEQQVRK